MSSTKALIESLGSTAAELAALDAKMTSAPWKYFRTGGSVGDVPETVEVNSGKDRWVAFPNDEVASVEKDVFDGEEVEALTYPPGVYKRIHPDAAGVAECRNRLASVVALLRLAAAELDRLTNTSKPGIQ